MTGLPFKKSGQAFFNKNIKPEYSNPPMTESMIPTMNDIRQHIDNPEVKVFKNVDI